MNSSLPLNPQLHTLSPDPKPTPIGRPGNDRFSTKDGNHDIVDCGPGEDIAVGDPHDSFMHCEHVYTTPANTPEEPPVIG